MTALKNRLILKWAIYFEPEARKGEKVTESTLQ